MNYKNYIPKTSISNFKAHSLPSNTPSIATSTEDRKNTDRNEEKYDLQKYLNVYESIEKRELLVNNKKQTNSKLIQVKKCINYKNGIFENPFIQNSCSQLFDQQLNMVTQTNYKILNDKTKEKNKFAQKIIANPSKKNEMSLRMIAKHKFINNENQARFYDKDATNFIQQEPMIQSKGKDLIVRPLSFNDSFHFQRSIDKNKQRNILTAQNSQKPYKSYYQSKYQNKYRKPTQNRWRNSKNFIVEVDKFIQSQKSRYKIIRPQTCNLRNILSNDGNKILSFEMGKVPKRFQSQAKIQNSKKQQAKIFNQMPDQKTKRYFFQKKYHQPLKSFSFHPEDEKQNHKIHCNLSITTETPLTKSIFLTSKQQDVIRQNKIVNSSHQKKTLQKKFIRNNKMNEKFHQKSREISPLIENKIQKVESSRMTLNKIQEIIANDLQISIRHLDTKY